MVKSFSSKSNQSNLMLGRDLRGRTKEKPKATPRSRSKGFPHLEEIWLGEVVDLDLLSLFPLEGGKNHGGMERRQALKRSTMEERERVPRVGYLFGKKAP